MGEPLWSWSALNLAAAIRKSQISCRDATDSVLDRIAEVNPRINALAQVLVREAQLAADAADRAVRAGEPLAALHGVPVTVKVNIDQAGCATTDGSVALQDNVASSDSPPVASLKRAGCVIVGRSNTPAYSFRWFTSNELHGRTLNPWNDGITPGGSSGGAAAAVATGMGAIAHGNDYGGSVRYPAYACGVVGLRASAGRIAAHNATSASDRAITLQLMSVQGPLTRTVADARAALQAMAVADARDPLWVPAPLEFGPLESPLLVALFRRSTGSDVDPEVDAALEQAGRALEAAGCAVEETEPPHFDEAAQLWRTLVIDDQRRSGIPELFEHGDAGVKTALRFTLEGMGDTDRDSYLEGLARRHTIARAWSLFFARYPVVLMPVSWRLPVPVDEDLKSRAAMEALMAAQSPLLATALLGLPGLSVPTGLVSGLPMGVQLVSGRFREDLCLLAGEHIERALGRIAPMSPRFDRQAATHRT